MTRLALFLLRFQKTTPTHQKHLHDSGCLFLGLKTILLNSMGSKQGGFRWNKFSMLTHLNATETSQVIWDTLYSNTFNTNLIQKINKINHTKVKKTQKDLKKRF